VREDASRAASVDAGVVDVLGGDGVLLARGRDDHGGGRGAVEPAWDAGADIEQRGDSVVVEDGLVAGAGSIEPQADVVAVSSSESGASRATVVMRWSRA
jgi:hypothetical protein